MKTLKKIIFILIIISTLSQNVKSQYLPPHSLILFPDTNFMLDVGINYYPIDRGWASILNKIGNRLYLSGQFRKTYYNDKYLNNIAWYGIDGKLHNLNYGAFYDDGYGKILKYKGYIVPTAMGGEGYYTSNSLTGPRISSLAKFSDYSNQWTTLTPSNKYPMDNALTDGIVYHDTLVVVGADLDEDYHYISFVVNNEMIDLNNFGNLNTLNALSLYTCNVFKDELWVADNFYNVMAKYNPHTRTWTGRQKIGGGVSGGGSFLSVDTFNNFLYTTAPYYYAGGLIDTLGGTYLVPSDTIHTGLIVYYDGFHWNSLSKCKFGGYQGQLCLDFYRGYVFVGGMYTFVNSENDTINSLAAWDGEKWHKISDFTNVDIRDMEVFNDTLFLGTDFLPGVINGDSATIGFFRVYMDSDTTCHYLQPRVLSEAYTYRLHNDSALIRLYNNNDYAETWYWDFGDGNYGDTIQNTQHLYTDTGTYNVQVTVTHQGCSKTAERKIHILEELVSAKQNITQPISFKVYPNPAKGGFNIDIEMPEFYGKTKYKIKVFATNGVTKRTYYIQSGKNKFYVDASNWTEGIYLCSLFGDNTLIETKKVILK